LNQRKCINNISFLKDKPIAGKRISGKLILFFSSLFLSLCLTSPAWSSPLIQVKIVEQEESIGIGATGPYQIENSEGRIDSFPFSPSLQVMRATPSGIKIDGVAWGKQISVKPQGSDSLVLVGTLRGKRRYRGSITVEQEENYLRVINQLPLEEYLYGVIKWEISPNWPMDSLCAQAIAARTYALKKIEEPSYQEQLHHLSATVNDQVYGGFESEDPRIQEAVDMTRGKIITYQGDLINAFYHSCCGGHTVSSKDVWGGEDFPYLRVGPDKFCEKSPYYYWEWEIKRSELRRILFEQGFPSGIIYRLRIVSRAQNLSFTEGGRITGLFWEHQGGKSPSQPMTGKEFRELINKWFGTDKLRSALFDEVKLYSKEGTSYFLLSGRGSGHGVGMCQWGAKGMAEQGYSFEEILQFYHPETRIEKRY
jgi:stage II sporulation protein D